MPVPGEKASVVSVENIQNGLPADAVLVEYFVARDEILVFVISHNAATVRRHLCTLSQVQALNDQLRLNLDKFLIGDEYVRQYEKALQQTVEQCLDKLYCLLIQPIENLLDGAHLIVVPHDTLHYVPFHALRDRGQYLIDRFTVSYAPSASVWWCCMKSEPVQSGSATIIGVPDHRAPLIADEVNRLYEMLPDARLFYGARATRHVISQEVTKSHCVHFASHVIFRPDQPMNSSLTLADGALTAMDLYSMKCHTNLVTLSGCNSGMSTLAEADELLGLIRGFLCAGARSLILSLWPVNDRATLLFMKTFYAAWLGGRTKSQALREAACTVRDEHPHPYFWAPFFLAGDFQ
jgi:CHAT domain-containing protein